MSERYKIIPRTLIFLFHGNEILLIKHNSKEKIGFGRWNGIGGHIERGEDPFHAAIREIKEETGLSLKKINFSFFTIVPETDAYGIGLFIYSGRSRNKKIIESNEGQLKWIDIKELNHYPLMEDLEIFLDLVINHRKCSISRFLSYHKEKNGVKVQIVG
jgi:8-oxo-dGTP diphosphatase